jgi:Kdo2-lipid IVA lauroyltransferase/acyltransferase
LGSILFYLVLKPLSLLPLPVLYWFSDLTYVIVYKILGYRKDVVFENLANAFPDKSEAERKEIAGKFYHFMTDLMVEILWCFSLTEKRIRHRFKVLNPGLLDDFHAAGKSVVLILAHYSSWEMVLSSLNLFVKHRVTTIYVPMTNGAFDKAFYRMRTIFKAKMIAKREFKESFDTNTELNAIIFGADQSPSISKNLYWTQFLNQETAVALGAEKYAKLYDMPVVYARLKKEKRGFYSLEFETVSAQPALEPDGEITEGHVRLLERQILSKPEDWLWSHKRWKKKRAPEA